MSKLETDIVKKVLDDFYKNYCYLIQNSFLSNNVNNRKIFNKLNNVYDNFFDKVTELVYLKLNKKTVYSNIFCKNCGSKNRFINITEGYGVFCCRKCANSNKEKINKTKNTYKQKYGCDFYIQTEEFKEKSKQTKIDKYNDPYYHNKEKAKLKYKSKEFVKEINKKREQTFLNKIGYISNLCVPGFKEKSKQTKLERYGDKNYNNRIKAKQTCLKTYGVDHFTKTQQYKEIFDDKFFVDNMNKKIYLTKKKNGTFNTSKPENECFELLKQKYPDTIHSYKSKLYPFNCDLYVPSLDLYIELNLHWTHGKEPFDINNKEHLKILETWENKAFKTGSKFFKDSILIWTQRDPLKLNTFKNNNLNYKIFYTEKEFIDWFNKI